MARSRWLLTAVALLAVLASCDGAPDGESSGRPGSSPSGGTVTVAPGPGGATSAPPDASAGPPAGRGPVTLGFAGDGHFEGLLAQRLRRPRTALLPVAAALRRPDLMMLNLESSITGRGRPEPKEYQFRASARALTALDAVGVDVVSLANNHAVDYGRVGLRDTLSAVRRSPVPVVGIGADVGAAFRPHVVSVRGTAIAVLAATTKPDRTARAWAAGADEPGVAVAVRPRPRLVRAVRAAADRVDVVVVYLHWGREYGACPNNRTSGYASTLVAAGADVVVGSHAHVLLGAGWLGNSYIDYGLGNFAWYNQNSVRTAS